MAKKLTVVALATTVTGCISYNTPGDFLFRSAQVVTWGEQRELPAPYPNSDLSLDRQLLKIEFTSAEDFGDYLAENSYPASVAAYFCERPDYPVFLSRSSIFWDGQDIGALSHSSTKQPMAAGQYTYHTYIDIAGKEGLSSDRPRFRAFDLRRQTDDVCLSLRGGSGISGYQSNVVKIPKEELRRALGLQ